MNYSQVRTFAETLRRCREKATCEKSLGLASWAEVKNRRYQGHIFMLKKSGTGVFELPLLPCVVSCVFIFVLFSAEKTALVSGLW